MKTNKILKKNGKILKIGNIGSVIIIGEIRA
jgi:hypothetical protein